ncbi:MAG TPA: MBL fold metallo-hydrolase [Eubacteriaceae bacterium]|nr:MBL fold metallo-hydrolase [Eubacteriaceae bacterium]
MILEIIPVGLLAANCYIIGCEDTNEGVVIDPGENGEKILSKIEELGLNIKYIILTHGHFDHIGAVNEVKNNTNGLVAIHSLDKEMVEDEKRSGNNRRSVAIDSYNVDLKDGDIITIGNLDLKIIHTPGHSPGGICIYTEDTVFTGDTLFAGSIGRTDFYKGNMEELLFSIKNKLFTLPNDTKVYPGHGPSSTILEEKNTNPFFI